MRTELVLAACVIIAIGLANSGGGGHINYEKEFCSRTAKTTDEYKACVKTLLPKPEGME